MKLAGSSPWPTWSIPGAETPQNVTLGQKAEINFRKVLERAPGDKTALASLAELIYLESFGRQDMPDKFAKLDEAKALLEKLKAADPNNSEVYYFLGVIGWAKAYPQLAEARQQLRMNLQDPGPLPNNGVRGDLQTRIGPLFDDAIQQFTEALRRDKDYFDAMAYTNLCYRERADLADSKADYDRDMNRAEDYFRAAIEARRSNRSRQGSATLFFSELPPPPPPPPPPFPPPPRRVVTPPSVPAPPPPRAKSGPVPQRMRVGGMVMQANLIRKVQPVYPQLAKQARIQGTVSFTAIIGKDGAIQDLQLIGGHPLLVQAARDAVKQWVYRPTLLNGQPVEVVTQIDVNFTLVQ